MKKIYSFLLTLMIGVCSYGQITISALNTPYTQNFDAMGATGPSDARYQHTAIMQNMFGANLQIISGYKGSSDVRLAMERGEIVGNCGDSWSSLKSTAADWVREKKINVVAQFSISKHPELQDIMTIIEHARRLFMRGETQNQVLVLQTLPASEALRKRLRPSRFKRRQDVKIQRGI